MPETTSALSHSSGALQILFADPVRLPTVVRIRKELQQRRFKLDRKVFPEASAASL